MIIAKGSVRHRFDVDEGWIIESENRELSCKRSE